MGRKNKALVAIFVILTGIYFCLSVFVPADPKVLKAYNISSHDAQLINLSVVIPLILIWLTALYGFLRFRIYAQLIKKSQEGRAFSRLADGLMVLAFSLPLSSIVSNLATKVGVNHPNLLPASVIFKNYVAVAISLATFILLNRGASSLVNTLKTNQKQTKIFVKYNNAFLIILGSLFSWLILTRPLSSSSSQAIYHLDDWLIILTLAIPYVFAWHQGVEASSKLFLYTRKVKGHVYKQAFYSLAAGVSSIVVVAFLLQFITTISDRLTRLHLTPLLLIVYFIIILYALGYGLVARGAKKLKKIEEV